MKHRFLSLAVGVGTVALVNACSHTPDAATDLGSQDGGSTDPPIDRPQSRLTTAPTTPVWTQHYDNARTGAKLDEKVLTPDSITAGAFGLAFTRKVQGQIYAQPLFVSGVAIPGQGTHDVVIVATEHDMIYAFDATDPALDAPLWQRSMGTPMSSHDLDAEVNGDDPNGPGYLDLAPEVGVTSTPVIDAALGTIYVVAKTSEPEGTYAHRLHALSLTDGSERAGSPVAIDAKGPNGLVLDHKHGLQRSAVTLDKGVLYFAFAGHADLAPWHGWVLAYDAKTLVQRGVFVTTPTSDGGGIWQAGQGLGVDENANVYFASGNGLYDARTTPPSLGDSIVKLHLSGTGLDVLDWFTPHDELDLFNADLDLGSAGMLLVPGTSLLVGGGKTGKQYVVDRATMGKKGASSDSQIPQVFQGVVGDATPPQLFGAPIWWSNDQGAARMFLWGEHAHLTSFRWKDGAFDPEPEAQSSLASAGQPGGILALSADSDKHGTGVVWALVPAADNDDGASFVRVTLRAFDAEDVTRELWNSDTTPGDAVGTLVKFCPPVVAGGRVFAATGDGALRVYGLRTN